MIPRDLRFQQTERLIEAAFIELCQEQGSFDVTVSEVCARAGVSRSTFYLHYAGVAALMASIQERLLALAEANLSRALPWVLTHGTAGLADYFEPILPLVRENRPALLLFLGPNGSAQFAYRLKETGKTQMRRIFAANRVAQDDKRTEYLIEYMASAGLGLIVHWLRDDMSMPVEELVALLGVILFNGPLAAGFDPGYLPADRP
jgi:AcrR family transcriptional regulator